MSIQRQFTATVYIIKDDKVLLIFHKKHQKWLPPGGHLEENELPTEGAKREVLEETGLHIEFIRHEKVWVDPLPHGRSFERPYMCLLEEIPERPSEPAHQHMDLIYVATPVGGKETLNHYETEGLKWFTLEDLDRIEHCLVFPETRLAIKQILTDFI